MRIAKNSRGPRTVNRNKSRSPNSGIADRLWRGSAAAIPGPMLFSVSCTSSGSHQPIPRCHAEYEH